MNDPIISLDIWNIFVAICNVLILYKVLSKLLFAKVKAVIDGRESEIATAFNEAETAKAEALKMKSDYEKNIAKAQDEASDIIKEATTAATKRSDAILADAQAQTAEIKKKAEASIELERKRAVSELRSDISELVTMAASKVIEKEINADDHKELIQSFVEKVGE